MRWDFGENIQVDPLLNLLQTRQRLADCPLPSRSLRNRIRALVLSRRVRSSEDVRSVVAHKPREVLVVVDDWQFPLIQSLRVRQAAFDVCTVKSARVMRVPDLSTEAALVILPV